MMVGLTSFIRSNGGTPEGEVRRILSRALNDNRSIWTFGISSLFYGLLFAAISGTIIFRPGSTFSNAYGVSVPSMIPVVCCGSLGQTPQLVLYITQQFAVLIVPLNLVLLVIISWLVGINGALAAYAFENRPPSNAKWLVGLGATVGLFTACPTCAGLFTLTSFGLSATVFGTLALGSLQTIFIMVTLPILLFTLVLSSKSIERAHCATDIHRGSKK